MNGKKFNHLLQCRVDEMKKTLSNKSNEYSTDEDKLHNFKRAAIEANTSPEKALMGMLLKHRISILDIIDKLDKGILPAKALLDEKIGDYINYLVLLEALIKERIEEKE